MSLIEGQTCFEVGEDCVANADRGEVVAHRAMVGDEVTQNLTHGVGVRTEHHLRT